MIRFGCSAGRIAAIIAAFAACTPRSQGASLDPDAAFMVVSSFVALDSAGNGVAPEASAFFMPCDARVTDRLEPILSTRVERIGSSGNSVAFMVSYDVVGLAFSRGDASEVGARDWRFRYEPRMQVDTMRVVRESGGELRIACGPHYGNHPASETLGWLRERLDSASMADWRRAQEAATRAGKHLP